MDLLCSHDNLTLQAHWQTELALVSELRLLGGGTASPIASRSIRFNPHLAWAIVLGPSFSPRKVVHPEPGAFQVLPTNFSPKPRTWKKV